MAKKKEKIVIKTDALSVTELGERLERKGNLLFLLIIFILLIGAIIGAPYISTFLENKKKAQIVEEPVIIDSEPEEEKEEPKELVCKKDGEVITYYNKEGIYRIVDVIKIKISDEGYIDKYNNYSSIVEGYKDTKGYEASSEILNEEVEFKIIVDLDKADIENTKSSYYFSQGTKLDVVSKTMTKKGFTCK